MRRGGDNPGLAPMIALSLLPVGLAQTWASVEHGLWYARSADFLQLPWMVTLRWFRIVGDTVFLAGTLALVWFLLGLWLGWSYEPERKTVPRWSAGSAQPSVAS